MFFSEKHLRESEVDKMTTYNLMKSNAVLPMGRNLFQWV